MNDVYEKLSKENYMIGIPSRKRAFMIKTRRGFWRHFKPGSTKKYPITMVVREEEKEEYSKTILEEGLYVEIASIKDDATIAEKRDFLIQEAIRKQKEYLFIADDDISIYYREESLSSKYSCKLEEVFKRETFDNALYECIKLCNETYPLVGFPLKQGSFALKYMFPKNIQILHFVCYHVPTLKKEGIRATGLNTTFMSDRYVELSLLEKGYMSLGNCRFCIGDINTGYKGGCSETRTVELQEKAAHKLCERFPEHVSLKRKENGFWDEPRYDCTILWKKFLKEGESKFIPSDEGLRIIGE